MKRKIWRWSRVLTVCVLVVCMSGSIIQKNFGADIEDEKKKQEEMQDKLKDTESLLSELETKKNDTEAYISGLDARMNELSASIYELEQSLDAKRATIEETKVAIVEAQAEVDRQYEAMKLRIQYMYENGETSYMTMILDSESMSDFLNRAEYLSQITAYDREQLGKFQLAKADLDAKEAKLEAEEADLEAVLAEIEEEKAATEELAAAKRELLANYQTEIAATETEIANLEGDIETQKAIIAELEEIERKRKEEEAKKAAANKITYDGGSMIWPIPGYTYLSSYFGTRDNPFGQATQEYHSGIDVPAPQGTQIIAAYEGEVAWSYYSSSAGNWVGIDHGNGLYTVYMHMSQRLVSEGDWVSTGQVIGLVGTTGRSTGNHLHFGVRKNGSYVDPLNWVSP